MIGCFGPQDAQRCTTEDFLYRAHRHRFISDMRVSLVADPCIGRTRNPSDLKQRRVGGRNGSRDFAPHRPPPLSQPPEDPWPHLLHFSLRGRTVREDILQNIRIVPTRIKTAGSKSPP